MNSLEHEIEKTIDSLKEFNTALATLLSVVRKMKKLEEEVNNI